MLGAVDLTYSEGGERGINRGAGSLSSTLVTSERLLGLIGSSAVGQNGCGDEGSKLHLVTVMLKYGSVMQLKESGCR